MNKKSNKFRQYVRTVDEESGEVLREYNALIVDDGLILIENDNNFTKVYGKELMNYIDKMENLDYHVILCLLNNIGYETCILTKTGTNDVRYALKHEDISIITSLSLKSVGRSMARLVEIGLLINVKHKNSKIYYANPFVFMKGNKISKAIVDIFKNK